MVSFLKKKNSTDTSTRNESRPYVGVCFRIRRIQWCSQNLLIRVGRYSSRCLNIAAHISVYRDSARTIMWYITRFFSFVSSGASFTLKNWFSRPIDDFWMTVDQIDVSAKESTSFPVKPIHCSITTPKISPNSMLTYIHFAFKQRLDQSYNKMDLLSCSTCCWVLYTKEQLSFLLFLSNVASKWLLYRIIHIYWVKLWVL